MTGAGTLTRIGSPAPISAALAGGSSHARPRASSLSDPVDAHSR
ncbi:hypothetical protein [Actinosynnema mirum]|uniref:Uncharacterized protein n=1 Tax=Actinosynnema mirum (strain ATCC 29888 / DSM 43827 / JCM 3225 / NBRC 14064 / NCIMB 13271 / NRRL B-12336 / IMRU 3971 / 101) TaxID=446462 RepID=C6WKA3_ACTMD|nr:hypothetical protein [Actinosynnema mirum]ACU38316.1 hypothetical protein Amir_4470 [Actinosynnema mirum DSM 43827]